MVQELLLPPAAMRPPKPDILGIVIKGIGGLALVAGIGGAIEEWILGQWKLAIQMFVAGLTGAAIAVGVAEIFDRVSQIATYVREGTELAYKEAKERQRVATPKIGRSAKESSPELSGRREKMRTHW